MPLAARQEQRVFVGDLGDVPEQIGLGGRRVGVLRDEASKPHFGLGADAAIAEQSTRVVAPADGVVAGGELLERDQRPRCVLAAKVERQRQLWVGTELAVN